MEEHKEGREKIRWQTYVYTASVTRFCLLLAFVNPTLPSAWPQRGSTHMFITQSCGTIINNPSRLIVNLRGRREGREKLHYYIQCHVVT